MNKKNKFYSSEEERPFNFAIELLRRCNLLLLKANESSVTSDFHIWFGCLKALRRSIIFKLDEKEIKKINEKLNTIAGSLKNNNTLEVDEKLEDAEIWIINKMYESGLYYPKYSKKNWEEVAEEEDV